MIMVKTKDELHAQRVMSLHVDGEGEGGKRRIAWEVMWKKREWVVARRVTGQNGSKRRVATTQNKKRQEGNFVGVFFYVINSSK